MDEVTGLCVLGMIYQDYYLLWHRQTKADGSKQDSHIACYPADKPKPDTTHPIWQFEREGTRLHLTPSLHNLATRFHSAFNWSVDFVEVNPTLESYGGSRLFTELNMHPEYVKLRLIELKEDGIIL